MISAKLIKSLEKQGFLLEFPGYNSPEEIIIEILKENNPRIFPSLSFFLKEEFGYPKIYSKLTSSQKKEFDKAILISEKIYRNKNINNSLKELIKREKIKRNFSKKEFEETYAAFKEAQINAEKKEQKIIEKQSRLRLNLNLNKSLQVLFSPAKIRIMEKIFNHEELTNTELKYYYRSISSINKAVLNSALQDYLNIIEITKKNTEKTGEVLKKETKRAGK